MQGTELGGRCGACGYPVHGIPTFTCPECGHDLRHVGIATRRMALGRFPFLPWVSNFSIAMVGWTIALFVVAEALYFFVSENSPRVTKADYIVRFTDSSIPEASELTLEGSGVASEIRVDTMVPTNVKLTIVSAAGTSRTAKIDVTSRTFVYDNPTTGAQERSSFTADRLAAWISPGVLTDTRVSRTVRQVMDVVASPLGSQANSLQTDSFELGRNASSLRRGNETLQSDWSGAWNADKSLFRKVTATVGVSVHPVVWPVVAVETGLLLLWLYGAWRLARRLKLRLS